MTVYILLFVWFFITPSLSRFCKTSSNRRKVQIILSCLGLLAVYTLRSFTVGQDIPGYEYGYNTIKEVDYYNSYLEQGYVLLIDTFDTLGFTFRGFLFFVYITFLVSLGVYIYVYSKDIALSFAIFVGFQFFVFTMSGIRQTLATGLCIFALIIAQNKDRMSLFAFCAIVLASCYIHKSSIVFFPSYFILRKKLTKGLAILYFLGGIVCFFIRTPLNFYLRASSITNYEVNDKIGLGITFVMLLFLTVWAYYLSINESKSELLEVCNTINISLVNHVSLMIVSLILMIVFNGTILMRAAMYYEITLLIMVPNMLDNIKNKYREVVRHGIILMFFILFLYGVLIPNELNIVPYEFASEFSLFK